MPPISGDMATRTLGVALWEYRDNSGRRRRVYYGDTFELPEPEVERGERADVFATAGAVDDPTEGSTNAELVDWLVERRGADRDTIRRLRKQALWQLVRS